MSRASAIFANLGDETRVSILLLLVKHEMSVQEIVDKLQTSQPNISQHLRKLDDAGLVSSKRHGQKIAYRIQKKILQRELEKFLIEIGCPRHTFRNQPGLK